MLFTAECPVGTYYDSDADDCLLCPEGTYNQREGVLQCTPCPEGTWTVGTRQENFTACTGECFLTKVLDCTRSLSIISFALGFTTWVKVNNYKSQAWTFLPTGKIAH